jgi:fructokinase
MRPAHPEPVSSPALGIDLGGTKIEARLLDPAGVELWRQRVPTPMGSYVETLDAIEALVGQARQTLGADARTPAFPIGIGTPGTPRADGRIKNANSTRLNGQPLKADLEARLGQPIALANDANCLALSEAVDGAGAGAAVVFAVILGTGVGGGIAVDGRVLGGPNGLGGEWGHNPLPWQDDDELRLGPPIECHSELPSCIEGWLSGTALGADHRRRGGNAQSGAEVAQAALAGEALALACIADHRRRLGRALASIINLLDPDVIVLAGGLSQLPGLVEDLPALWTPWVFGAQHDAPVRTRIALARHGDASGVRGAAWLGRALPTSTTG